jgi:hypothetical protein
MPLALLQCASAKTSSGGNILCDGCPDEMWTSPAGSQGMMDGRLDVYVTADTGLIQTLARSIISINPRLAGTGLNPWPPACMHDAASSWNRGKTHEFLRGNSVITSAACAT